MINKTQASRKKVAQLNDSIYILTLQVLVFISLHFNPLSSKAGESHLDFDTNTVSVERFIRLDSQGAPAQIAPVGANNLSWECVLDTETALVWEVKTIAGLRNRQNTYTWYNPNSRTNGGDSGYPNGGQCSDSPCDTSLYVEAINKTALCGYHSWRLPSREELRSLVDYEARAPHPVINKQYFPQSMMQFYWSSTPDASDADSAWGIGFTFGYDYSYFKSDLGFIRLVTNYRR